MIGEDLTIDAAIETKPTAAADEVRAEILRHSEDLFAHYGFAKTSMADIAERCGMSPGNLYRYFRNKQAIGVAVTEAFFRQNEAELLAEMERAGEEPEARIRAIFLTGLGQMIRKMDRAPKLMELVEFLCGEDGPYDVIYRHISWKRELVQAELARGMALGRFRQAPLYETAVNLMHALKAFQMPQMLALWRDPATILPEFRGVLDLVFDGVRAR